MSLSDEQAAFLLDACALIKYATEQGFKVTGGELSRTPEQQAIYGGGRITHDANDQINWQCSNCGRWALVVDKRRSQA